ncbi:uncharacterized protein LOC118348064 [Juglans regia]|uniref:Uncharacterized protein LOC118348064 n=1 Tax=Juglans regia TaxID=51240 RepID=A0A6P9EQK0_JUGRE|nr:uncharacterized protein LOC118348064 [Juglans regia]
MWMELNVIQIHSITMPSVKCFKRLVLMEEFQLLRKSTCRIFHSNIMMILLCYSSHSLSKGLEVHRLFEVHAANDPQRNPALASKSFRNGVSSSGDTSSSASSEVTSATQKKTKGTNPFDQV